MASGVAPIPRRRGGQRLSIARAVKCPRPPSATSYMRSVPRLARANGLRGAAEAQAADGLAQVVVSYVVVLGHATHMRHHLPRREGLPRRMWVAIDPVAVPFHTTHETLDT